MSSEQAPPQQVHEQGTHAHQADADRAVEYGQRFGLQYAQRNRENRCPTHNRGGSGDLFAYSAESGHRFRANPATPRSPATQGLSGLSALADFRPISSVVCAWTLL